MCIYPINTNKMNQVCALAAATDVRVFHEDVVDIVYAHWSSGVVHFACVNMQLGDVTILDSPVQINAIDAEIDAIITFASESSIVFQSTDSIRVCTYDTATRRVSVVSCRTIPDIPATLPTIVVISAFEFLRISPLRLCKVTYDQAINISVEETLCTDHMFDTTTPGRFQFTSCRERNVVAIAPRTETAGSMLHLFNTATSPAVHCKRRINRSINSIALSDNGQQLAILSTTPDIQIIITTVVYRDNNQIELVFDRIVTDIPPDYRWIRESRYAPTALFTPVHRRACSFRFAQDDTRLNIWCHEGVRSLRVFGRSEGFDEVYPMLMPERATFELTSHGAIATFQNDNPGPHVLHRVRVNNYRASTLLLVLAHWRSRRGLPPELWDWITNQFDLN